MSGSAPFLARRPEVINFGLELFHEALTRQSARSIQVDWRPPAEASAGLAALDEEAVETANAAAVARLLEAEPVLVDVRPAAEAIPGMTRNTILHAGPPVTWERMCGPMRGAVIGALLYERLASGAREAGRLAASGEIVFSPCHHHQAVGPMAGVVSFSMPVWDVHNTRHGNHAYCTLNEGLGKVLRFGAYGREVISRLRWMERVLGPALGEAVRKAGGIPLRPMTAQALQMGDECHNRNVAATSLFIREITPHLLAGGASKKKVSEIVRFISGNNHFFLNLSMAACKAATDTTLGFPGSTLVSAMARNGTEIGIRVAGLGERWFTAPAGNPVGLFFSGFGQEDANPDLGDSTVSEVAGIGGFAMAGAPAIVQFIGGKPADALRYTLEMGEICVASHPLYRMPALDFAGTPVGIDVLKVVASRITPVINTGIAHRQPGIGQVGAGILRAPVEIFDAALDAFLVSTARPPA